MDQQILAGTSDGLYEINGDSKPQLAGRDVKALAKDGPEWWAVVDEGDVMRATGKGAWHQVATLNDVAANCLQPYDGQLFVGAAEAQVFVLSGESLEQVGSFDQTEGHETWHTPWGGPPDVRSMSPDPAGALYANVHVGGIARTADGGENWSPTIEVSADVHQVHFDPNSRTVLAASARGLGVSSDEGATWRYEGEGLHGRYMRSVAVAGDTVLVTASTGPFTNRGALYRKSLGSDGPFEKCEQGLPEWFPGNVDTYCLAASGARAIFGTSEGEIFRSEDEGRTWTRTAQGLPGVRCIALG